MAKHSPYASYSVSQKRYKNYRPKPPTKSVTRRFRKTCRRRIHTEFHDALFSFGCDNRTHKLSDREFARQIFVELDYLTDLSLSYFGSAARHFGELLRLLF